ncbi:unnamed protein product [[Candida] boidinii]|uniref:Unnamed protein product n=1 Tax=Candida boidinii TaxID=5477 RepID=A0ACB5TKT1_CANBO|nr:unnamed protein product [[Candida] boidinii]
MFSIFDLRLVREKNQINKLNGFNPFSYLYNTENYFVSSFNSFLNTFTFNWISNKLNFFKHTSQNFKLIKNDRNIKTNSDELENDLFFNSSIKIDNRLTNNSVKPCAVTDLDFQGINYEYFDYEDSNHLTDLNTNNNISNNTNVINNNNNNYKNSFEEFHNSYNTINNHGLYNNNSNLEINNNNNIDNNSGFNVGSSSSINHDNDDSINNSKDYNHNFVKFNQNAIRDSEFDLNLLQDIQNFPGHSFQYEQEKLNDKKRNEFKDSNRNNNHVSVNSKKQNLSEVNTNPFNWNLRELVLEDDGKFNNSRNFTEEEEVSDYFEEIDHTRSTKETIKDDYYGNEFALDDEYCLEKCFSRTETTKKHSNLRLN